MSTHTTSREASKLSILNPQRRCLTGPEFLDNFFYPDNAKAEALVYLDAANVQASLTYAQVNKSAICLASSLQEQFSNVLAAKTTIPVLLPQHPTLYISYLAVLKTGAAFCPVASDTPPERLAFIIKDVNAKVVLCQSRDLNNLRSLLPHVQCFAVELNELLCSGHRSLPVVSRQSTDTAYVMYTSGSTGKPKGVPISHQSVCQSLLAHDEHIPSFRRFLQFAASTFDVSIFEIFFPWSRGSTLICCERERLLADLPGVINSLSVDAAELTPTVASSLLKNRIAVPGLTLLLTIGEMLTKKVVLEFGGTEDHESILYAMYGPTEAAIHCTIVPKMSSGDSVHNIGRPLSTATAFILNEDNQSKNDILELGKTGELAIAGQLAEGYLNREEQTNLAFVQLAGHGIVYRTGDSAKMTENGEIHILGRIADGQVKIRGQRVELGEIEAAASQASEVFLSAAILTDDSVVLFCSGSRSLQVKDVQNMCRKWLPRHMRPARILIVPKGLPQLPSGKIDRKQLKLMCEMEDCETSQENSDVTAYSSPLHKVFCEEMDSQIRPEESLREHGLDSLRAIRIASRLRQDWPAVSISSILESDSIHDLEAFIWSDSNIANGLSKKDTKLDLQRKLGTILESEQYCSYGLDIEHVIPCSPIQIAMLAETSQDSRINMNEIVLSHDPSITFELVISAFGELAKTNTILRTSFVPTSTAEMPFVQLIRRVASFTEPASLMQPIQLRKGSELNTIFVDIHHAVYDGWSWDIVMHELNLLVEGKAVLSRPIYEDYAYQRHAQILSESQEDLCFWVSDLANVRPSSMPILTSEVCQGDSRTTYTSTLKFAEARIRETARSLEVSSPALAHGILLLLLSGLMDTSQVTTGLVTAGRDPILPDLEHLIGPTLSILPVLAHIDQRETIQDLILMVHRKHMRCLKHSRVTLNQINKALSFCKDESLFDVIFVWQQSLYSEMRRPDDRIRIIETCDYLPQALLVEIEPQDGSLQLKSTFDPSKISSSQIEVLHQQLDSLLNIFATDPGIPIANIWSAFDPMTLSILHSDTATEQPDDLSILFDRLKHHDPEHLAIDFVTEYESASKSMRRQTLTYGQLDTVSRQLASNLRNQFRLSKNELVAIHSKKCIDLYTTICGVTRAGLAYLCIDPEVPLQRLIQILEQAKPALLLTDSFDLMPQISAYRVPVMLLHGFASRKCHTKFSEVPIAHTNLAYTVFTSGSTGVPKGVNITRGNLMSNIRHLESLYPYQSASKLLQSCSPAFDVSVFEIFWTWYCGLTLCSAVNDVLFRDIEEFININDISHLSMTPSVAALIKPANVPKVKFLVCSGEPMTARVFDDWRDHGLYQGYGPSETTNICNVRHYREGRSHVNNVGPAFPNTSLFICARQSDTGHDEELNLSHFRPVPIGRVGEIWIGGQQLGRGYTDPKLTSRSWLEHSTYGRLYRSGDIGRLLADGSLVVLGREDDQAKIRGQRIELIEINAKLIESQLVADACSLIVSDEHNRQLLVAFWVPSTDEQSQTTALFQHLQQVLPSSMIPELLIPLNEIPLTQQRKLNKKELLETYHNLNQAQKSLYSVAPDGNHDSGDSEDATLIVKILSELTQVPISDINNHTSFFAFGIDSIRAITFAQRLRESGFKQVDVSSIMKNSSVSRLVTHIASIKSQTSDALEGHHVLSREVEHIISEKLTMQGFKVKKVLPVTSLQESMLATHNSKTSKSYLNHMSFRIYTDLERLKSAWCHVQLRHEILNTLFAIVEESDQPFVQIVTEGQDLPWVEVEQVNLERTKSPFEGLPYSFQLVRSEDDVPKLHLSMHHVLYDADALEVLFKEVEAVLSGSQLSSPVPFSQYLGSAFQQQDVGQNGFWRNSLLDVVPTRLTDILKDCDSVWSVPNETTSSVTYGMLTQAARTQSTTILSLCQATLVRLLSQVLKTDDICFGTIFSGRSVESHDADQIVGPTFNSLPVRFKIRKSMTISDASSKLQQINAEITQYQTTSLRQLQREYSPDGQRLFDILLLLQTPKSKLNSSVWQLESESGQMAFPFILEVQPDPHTDSVAVQLHSTIITEPDIRDNVAVLYANVLNEICTKPQAPLIDKRYLSTSPHHATNENGHTKKPKENISKDTALDTSIGQEVLDAVRALTSKEKPNITAGTTIFELGLDSISAIRLSARLRSCGYNISSAAILEEPSIESIIQLCDESHPISKNHESMTNIDAFDKQHRPAVLSRSGLDTNSVQAIWPCTTTQIGILSEHIRSAGKVYANSMTYLLDSKIEFAVLRQAWERLVDRHQILRTGFVEVNDSLVPFAMIIYSSSCLPDIKVHHIMNDKVTAPLSDSLINPPWAVQIYEEYDYHKHMKIHMLHALFDATSLHSLLQDLARVYHQNALPAVPDLRTTVGQIVHDNHSGDIDMSFWKQKRGTIQPTRFPDLNIQRDVLPPRGWATRELSRSLAEIQRGCERAQCTLSVAFQAAWARLLSAYTGQESVVFGTVLSGRSYQVPGSDNVCFPCMNTLPIIVDYNNDTTPLLTQISKTNAHLHKYPHLPMTKVKLALSIEETLFDTLLVLQRPLDADKDAFWHLIEEEASAEYAVSLEIVPYGKLLLVRITYNHNIVPPAHGPLVLKQIEHLLYETLNLDNRNQDRPYDYVSMLPAKTPLIQSNHQTLHEMVLSTAARMPDEIAIEYVSDVKGNKILEKRWTYAQLVNISSWIASEALIHCAGAQRGDYVAICFEKCPQAPFALLGVLLAGCAYVAIDPGAPFSRQKFMIEDAKCKVLITSKSTALYEMRKALYDIWQEDFPVIDIEESDLDHTILNEIDPLPVIAADDTCYCLYTSGTTGTPKGCLISHKSVVQAMLSFSRIFEGHWTKDSRWLQFASYHFDVSVLEHFWSWSEGIRVTIAPRDLLFEDLPGTIAKLGITHLDLTPSLARLLTPETVPSLREGVFIVGGEQVRQDIIDTWGDAGCLYNFYGPSEVTIGCTVHPRVQRHVKPTNIGQQWDNVGSYVLKPDTEEVVLIGAIGELCLSGPLVGKGYLNRPDLTAEKFVTLKALGERVYRTGDLVRMLHEGSFEFLGRIDDQVKLRGQRLELGEINHVISKSTGLEVAALVVTHPEHEKEHLIVVLAKHNLVSDGSKAPRLSENYHATTQITKARSVAIDGLPGYMVPTYFLMIDYIPLTGNNKADLKALKKFYESTKLGSIREVLQKGVKHSGFARAHSEKVLAVLAKVVNIPTETISGSESLFQLGFDSISAIALSRELRAAGYANASVATILKHSNIDDLVRMLADNSDNDTFEQAVAQARHHIQAFGRRNWDAVDKVLGQLSIVKYVLPATPMQQGMISRLITNDAETPPYLNKFVYQLASHCDLDRFRDTWHKLTKRLDILRTHFAPTVDGYAQVVLTDLEVPGVRFDWISSETDMNVKLEANFDTWVYEVRRLSSKLPWQLHLLYNSEAGINYLALFMFHGIYDGISLDLLLEALFTLYNDPTTDISNIQFHDALPYGPLLSIDDAADFWQQQIPHVSLLELQPAGNPQSVSPIVYEKSITSMAVINTCKALEVTPQAVFQAVLLHTLSIHFDTNPSIGIVVSGRSIDLEGADQIIGPMFNTIPLAVAGLSAGSTLADLIQLCHQKNVDMLPYQHSPLSSIRRWLKVDPSKELFNCLLSYQTMAAEMKNASEYLFQELKQEQLAPDYPLNFEVEEMGLGRFKITGIADGAVLKHASLEMISDSFSETLEALDTKSRTSLNRTFLHDTLLDTGKERASKLLPSDATPEHDKAGANQSQMTSTMRVIRSVLADMSGVQPDIISSHLPTIFELGLDSVDALKLAARLKVHDIKVSVSKILRSPTVTGIANANMCMDSTTRHGPSAEQIQERWHKVAIDNGIDTTATDYVYPVTQMQESLLIDYAKYYNVFVHKVSEGYEIGRLIHAIHRAVQDLPVLRTKFVMLEKPVDNTTFLQLVMKLDHDTSSYDKVLRCEDEAEVRTHATRLKTSTDISLQPQLQLIVTTDSSTYLLLALSHALYDAGSLERMLGYIDKVYHDQEYAVVPQEPLISSYIDSACQVTSDQDAIDFWTAQMDGVHLSKCTSFCTAELRCLGPTSSWCVSTSSDKPSMLKTKFSAAGTTSMDSLCRRTGVTLQSIGLFAWTMLVADLTQQLDVSFGLVESGRTTAEAAELFFPTFNTVIFRPQLRTPCSAHDFLKQLHQLTTHIYEHQVYPLSKALSHTEHRVGLFDTLFTFQRASGSVLADQPLLEPIELVAGDISPPYAINVEMTEENEKLKWTIAVQKDVMDEVELDQIFAKLDAILIVLTYQQQTMITLENNKLRIDDWIVADIADESCGEDAQGVVEANTNENRTNDTTLTPEESKVRAVFAEISGVPEQEIQRTTNLYHLGLDSVSSIRITKALREDGLKIPVSVILKEQSVEAIAAAAAADRPPVQQTQHDNTSNTEAVRKRVQKSTLAADDIKDILPATGGQTFMLDMWRAGQGQLYPTFGFEIVNCSREVFEAAFKELLAAVPILRTQFREYEGQYFQVILKEGRTGPVQYKVTEDGDNLLVALHIHHALYDAISLNLMVRQLEVLCRTQKLKATPTIDIRPFINATTTDDPSRDLWTKYLQNTDRTRTWRDGTITAAHNRCFQNDVLDTRQLDLWCRSAGISGYSLFFAAIGRLLVRKRDAPNARSVTIGIYLSTRSLDIDKIEELIAPTLNIVPLKVDVTLPVLRSAKKIQDDLAQISKAANCGISMRQIHAWTGLKLDCYVNFMKLPGIEVHPSDPTEKQTTFRHATGDFKERAMKLSAGESISPFVDGTVNSEVPEWCQPALDVEAKIEGDRFMIGMFAPGDMLSEQELEGMIEEVKGLILGAKEELLAWSRKEKTRLATAKA